MINVGKKINIQINGKLNLKVSAGISVYEVVNYYKKYTGNPVVGAKIGNIILDFETTLYKDTKLTLFDYYDRVGTKMYQSGLKFLLIYAVRKLWGKNVFFRYSLDKGTYVEVNKRLTENDILNLKLEMERIVSYDYPIKRQVTNRKDAINYYLLEGEDEKASNVLNIPNNYVELYSLDHTYNFFYGPMPYSTGYLKFFDIKLIGDRGFVLLYPKIGQDKLIPAFNFNKKIYTVLRNYQSFAKTMNVEYAASINKIVADSKIQMFIKMNNIFINDALNSVAKKIKNKIKNIRIILIGGPSSSGKTTSSLKLCTYLQSYGINPLVISTDDYFKERKDNPKDEFGNYDFECLEAIDLKLFNKQLKDLVSGKGVKMPKFNFIKGIKEYNDKETFLGENNVIIIEGLHCLNDKLTSSIPREEKYKILVCPFTPLGIDRHNHVSTTDMRLIRRIVRDNRTRGYNALETIASWPKVVEGENKYIFNYMDDIDGILNTAFSYELGVLRVYAEPLLYSVPMNSIYFEEARRLIGLMRNFFTISSEFIEDDNVLREFIGGSIYDV